MDQLSCATCGIAYPIRKLDHSTTLRCLRCGGMLIGSGARKAVELPPAELPPPDAEERALGPYRLVRRLGKGGMGVVYEAFNTAAGGRRVALKTFELNDPVHDSARVLREAKLCASLPPHPNIVPLLDAVRVGDSTVCLEMELVDGVPLHEWRREGPPPLRRQAVVLRAVALALDHIHARGIVHRDLKPENVLVDREGRPRLTDFGLARMTDGDENTSTVTGAVVGTPTYMSPEQALKPRNADARSDIFSLGVMLYETLTGLLPFTGRSTVGLLMSIMNDTPARPSKVPGVWSAGEVDAEIEAVCLKALAKKPEERFQKARELADALGAWAAKKA